MEHKSAKKTTPRKTVKIPIPETTPPSKKGSASKGKQQMESGSKSATGRIKHTASKASPKKNVTFAKGEGGSKKMKIPQKSKLEESLAEKEEPTPKKKRSTPIKSTFGSGKGPKRKKPTAAEKGKQKVQGEIPQPTLFEDPSSDSSTDSAEARPFKKARPEEMVHTSVPESVGRWFSNSDLAAAFTKNYMGKSISPLKYLKVEDFLDSNLSCITDLLCQGIRSFLEFKHDLYPDLVKVFYCNLSVKSEIIRSKVKGVSIKITLDQLREYFQINEDNPETTNDSSLFKDFDRNDFYKFLCTSSELGSINLQHLKTGPLKAEDRLLHYFITYLVSPRGCNHALVLDPDLTLMYAIKNRIQINWGSHIVNHMKKSKSLQFLPFGFHISYLLQLSGVDLSGETKISPKSIALIDKAALGKLDLGWNPNLKTFDYTSDHTIKVRRTKPSRSSTQTRTSAQTPISLIEKVDTLTTLVMETNQRLGRLEALFMKFLVGEQPSTSAPQEEEEDDEDEEEEDAEEEEEVEEREGAEEAKGEEPPQKEVAQAEAQVEEAPQKEVQPATIVEEAPSTSAPQAQTQDLPSITQPITLTEETTAIIRSVLVDIEADDPPQPIISELD